MKEYAFGIDLGGTTAKIGLVKTTGALLEKWEVPTDTSNAGEHILKNLAAAVQGKMQDVYKRQVSARKNIAQSQKLQIFPAKSAFCLVVLTCVWYYT